MNRGVALGGMMGVGKTTVGGILSRRLSMPFVDTDEALSKRFGPIAEQFREAGEATFREREQALVRELCDGMPRVVATGGGLWVNAENRLRLRTHHVLVVLSASIGTLQQRVGRTSAKRPLWAELERHLQERAGAYADADIALDTSDRNAEEVVEEILCRL